MNETDTLSALRVGQSAYITKVEAESHMRRRLMDIGLIPGTQVTCVARSPAGDPAAYLIRGAVIALRRADAAGIQTEFHPEQTEARGMVLA